MYIHLFSFTENASNLAISLADLYKDLGHQCTCYTIKQFAVNPKLTAFPDSAKNKLAKVSTHKMPLFS